MPKQWDALQTEYVRISERIRYLNGYGSGLYTDFSVVYHAPKYLNKYFSMTNLCVSNHRELCYTSGYIII